MHKKAVLSFCCVFLLASCATTKPTKYSHTGSKNKATQRPYTVLGKRYEPLPTHKGFIQTGIASWYGRDFHGKKTSNGETYDMYAMTAAHKTLPLGVYVKVRNTRNGRDVIVRVNDRGPFVRGRIIDLSYTAAKKLGIDVAGTSFVRVEALGYKQEVGKVERYEEPATYDTGNYTVQVGAFKERANAERLSDEMKKQYGFSEMRLANVGGDRFYRVYTGKYTSLTAAETAEEALAKNGYPGSFVVALD